MSELKEAECVICGRVDYFNNPPARYVCSVCEDKENDFY